MPNVTALPRTLDNGNTITQFTDTTGISAVTYTYPTQQTSLVIENSGEKDIFVTVGSYTDQLIQADKKWKVDTPFTSFSIRSDVNSQEFIATVIYKSVEDLVSLTAKGSHFAKYQIETAGQPHQDGKSYTAFFSGCLYNGQELHVCRAGNGHSGNDGILVLYIRNEDGSITRKKIGGAIDYTIGDFRDPKISYNPTSGKVSVIASVKKASDGTYANYYMELNGAFDAASFLNMTGMDGYFAWGNAITSSDGFTLKLGYSVGSQGGVSLFKSGTISGNTIAFNKIADIFPASAAVPTECTITQWGDRLVVITRQNSGNMAYSQTYDLTGATGWSSLTTLAFAGDAPVLLPYTAKRDPLILGRCIGIPNYNRSPVFNISYDGLNWSNSLFADKLAPFGGGYHSLVPNRNGFGTMYYQDGSDPAQVTATTNVFYKEFDILKMLYKEDSIVNYNNNTLNYPLNVFRNSEVISGDCTFVDGMFATSANLTEITFEVKKSFSIKAIEMLLNSAVTLSCALTLYENGNLIATTPTVSVTTMTKTIYSFALSPSITLNLGSSYKIVLSAAAGVRNHAKSFTVPFGKVDFGDHVYLKTVHNGSNMPKHVVPFGLIKDI